jgi:tetratricopeptide (TPR) repeat protein/DNA-binding SARP family transcriptional activator
MSISLTPDFLVLGALTFGKSTQKLARSARCMFATLLLHRPYSVSAADLAEVVWDGEDWSSGAFRVLLTRTRHDLAQSGLVLEIVGSTQGYALIGELQTDVDLAKALLAKCRRGSVESVSSSEIYNILQLWRGEAYADLKELPRAVAQRQVIAELHRELTLELISRTLSEGDRNSALTLLTEQTARFPTDSHYAKLHSDLLWLRGRTTEALEVIRLHETALRSSTGLPPSLELKQIERAILVGYSHPGERDSPSSTVRSKLGADLARELAAKPGVVPRIRNGFFGRQKELSLLGELFQTRAIVTLTGSGGIGKTRLAAEYASTQPIEVRWIDLSLHREADLLEVIATASGVSWTGQTNLAARVAAHLQTSEMLLIFDNSDSRLEDVAVIAETIVQACEKIRVLCTSRAGLRSPSEAVLVVGPLEPDAAEELFADRQRAMRGVADDRKIPASLLESCGGMPLAIELASFADESAAVFGQRTIPFRTADRHRDVSITVRDSLDHIPEDAQDLFGCLSVIPGTFEVVDAYRVTRGSERSVRRSLAILVEHSLLIHDRDSAVDRYRLLEPLREVAGIELRKSGDREYIENRMWKLLADEVSSAAGALFGPDESAVSARLERADSLLRGMWDWALRNDVGLAATTLADLETFSFMRLKDSNFGWTRRVVKDPLIADHPRLPELLGSLALASWSRSSFDESTSLAHDALALSKRLEVRRPFSALSALQNVFGSQAISDEAVKWFLKVLDWTNKHGYGAQRVGAQVVMALGQAHLEQVTVARECIAAAFAITKAEPNPSSIAWAWYGTGVVELASRSNRAAEEAFLAAINEATPVHNRWVQGMAMAGLATALRRERTRDDEASGLLTDLIGHWYRGNMHGQLATALEEFAIVTDRMGDVERAKLALTARSQIATAHPMLPEDRSELSAIHQKLKFPTLITGDLDSHIAQLVA